ncbi:hypothetical protein HGRIS_000145 [Hohenbuehelia grisea]|uniref:Uncharacterized protein n=1 Tax=Hohenbuehelia grisea TaxID=104357 RepID=A0ABR3JRR5_9AGAR
MNSTTVSSFLKRRARIRTRRPTHSSPLNGEYLHIIPELSEEDEPSRASCSSPPCSPPSSPIRSLSPAQAVKAKRRQGNLKLADIRIDRDSFVQLDDDIPASSSLLCSPRPAPRPPASPQASDNHYKSASPDSFRLTFSEMGASYHFPQPPLSASRSPSFDFRGLSSPSPSLSCSSASSQDSSPSLRSVGLPTTPSSSDDEFPETPSLSIRCPSIRPLVIAKASSSTKDDDYDFDISVYTSPELLQPYKNDEELRFQSPVEPSSEPESDSEEASAWYTRELADVLTLCSPLPPACPLKPSRPESIFGPLRPSSPTPAPRNRRQSKPLPEVPRLALPSAQLDPAFPRRRPSIPKYAPPPPPVPALPAHLRPPPRMPIPADLDLSRDDVDYEYDFTSAYMCSPTVSTPSEYAFAQPEDDCDVEFDVDVQFDLDIDVPMRLPLSIPGTPIDFETDIAHAFEELRLRSVDAPVSSQAPVAAPAHIRTSMHISESPIACQTPDSYDFDASPADDEEDVFGYPNATPERALRSRWSSSTLSSTTDERPSPASKLRLYFGGAGGAKKRSSSGARKASVSIASPPPTPSHTRRRHTRGPSVASDVMVIGYGYPHANGGATGVRRRGSTSSGSITGSDAGSFDSSCSSGSSGLRRKPIPVEMFLSRTS